VQAADEAYQRLVHRRGAQSGHGKSIGFILGGHYLAAEIISAALVQDPLDVDSIHKWFTQRKFLSVSSGLTTQPL
jgi:hypothetical protein